MQFVTAKKDGYTIVRGKLSFEAECRITRHEVESLRHDVEADAKKKMKWSVWHKTYGELMQPLTELKHYALVGVRPQDELHVRELIDQLQVLLALPKE